MAKNSGVSFQRADFLKNKPRWDVVNDCASGMLEKEKREKYIIYSGSAKKTEEEIARYNTYVSRAVFYNYILRTLGGLTGLATSKDVIFKTGPRLEYAAMNIDGKGTTLKQSYKRTTSRVIAHGRYGLLVDFPVTPKAVTQGDINSGTYTATTVGYDAEQIINWGYQKRGSFIELSLVVLCESVSERSADGFTIEEVLQYRVLRLTPERVYIVEVYNEDGELKEEAIMPRLASGRFLDFIPFQFVGCTDNDGNIDQSSMFDLAVINIGHFQNSADYENSLWLCGQPQPWFTGMTQSWMEKNYPNGFYLGSGVLLTGPEGAAFGISQTEPNTQAFEAMGHKEEQMVAMGAKMISAEASFSTATEAAIQNKGEAGFLQSIIDNVESAYDQVLAWMGLFMGENNIEFSNPTDLSIYVTSPELVKEIRENWLAGLISATDARDFNRRHSLINRTDEEIEEDIELEPAGVDLDAE